MKSKDCVFRKNLIFDFLSAWTLYLLHEYLILSLLLFLYLLYHHPSRLMYVNLTETLGILNHGIRNNVVFFMTDQIAFVFIT